MVFTKIDFFLKKKNASCINRNGITVLKMFQNMLYPNKLSMTSSRNIVKAMILIWLQNRYGTM